jgi:hypothetical protein
MHPGAQAWQSGDHLDYNRIRHHEVRGSYGDTEFLHQEGAEILIETARMWQRPRLLFGPR